MRSTAMSPDDYRRQSGDLREAGRPSPSNVTDGRFFGDEVFADLLIPNSAATADQAAKISAVYFCVSLIAEAVGNCSFDLLEDGKPVDDMPLADALGYGPNPMQTAAEFWPSMLFRAALAGHAFAEPVIDDDQLYLWPLHPDRYEVDWRERGFTLRTVPEKGGASRLFNAGQLFWFSGLADARMQPLTPWKMAKGALDFALALENQGRQFFQNSKKLPGVVETNSKLDPEVHARLVEGVNKWRTGKMPVLEQGLSFKEVGSNNSDSQFVELIEQRTAEMARYWRIPRSFYASSSGPAKSDEQEAQTFVKYTARPWARRIEQAIRQRLLTPDQRRRIKVKVNLDSLLRGDSATQFRNAVLARTAGTHSVNDLRVGWFNLPRIAEDWADDPRTPLNSNRAADTMTGGETAPHDKVE